MFYESGTEEYNSILEYPSSNGCLIDVAASLKRFRERCLEHQDATGTLCRLENDEAIDKALRNLQSSFYQNPLADIMPIVVRSDSGDPSYSDEYSILEFIELLRRQLSDSATHQAFNSSESDHIPDSTSQRARILDDVSLETIAEEFSSLCRSVNINLPVTTRISNEPLAIEQPFDYSRCIYAKVEQNDDHTPSCIALEIDERLISATKLERTHTMKAEVYSLVDEPTFDDRIVLPENWPSLDQVHESFDSAEESHALRYPRNSLVVICDECESYHAIAPVTAAYGTCPVNNGVCPTCGNELTIALVNKPVIAVDKSLFFVLPNGDTPQITSKTLESNTSLRLDELIRINALASPCGIMRAVYESSGGLSFQQAWSYLFNHPLYRSQVPDLLDFGYLFTDPNTGRSESSGPKERNSQLSVYVESGGAYFDLDWCGHGKGYVPAHNLSYDTGGTSFEEAVINLAMKLKTRDALFADTA